MSILISYSVHGMTCVVAFSKKINLGMVKDIFGKKSSKLQKLQSLVTKCSCETQKI